jgi:hypothetical protein
MSLEEKVEDKESKGLIKKALELGWKIGVAAAATALSLSTVGSLGVIVGAAFATGGSIASLVKGESLYNIVSNALTTYGAVNAVIYPMVLLGDVTFPLISNATPAGWIARGFYASTIYNAAFVGSFRTAGHLINNYLSPKGLGKSLTEGFWTQWAYVGLLFSPFYALAANGVTQLSVLGTTLPTFAVGALPVGFALRYGFEKYWAKPAENHAKPASNHLASPAQSPAPHTSYAPAPA